MLKTKITEMLGIKYPILGGTMMHLSTAAFTAAISNAGELDTMLVMRSIGATHRVWKNAAALRCAELESDQASLPEILNVATGEKAKRMYREGDLDLGIISCGQGVGMVHDIPTVKNLFDRIMQEAGDVVRGLAAD